MPSGNTNPAIPQAQRSQFFTDNPWSDPYAEFNAGAANKSNTLFNRAMATDPTRDILSDPSKYTSAFNLNYPDVNNPGTIASLGKWSSVLGGGAETAIEAMLPKLFAAQTAGSRGGYRTAGGIDPTAQLQQQAIRETAGGYTDNVKQGMEWLKNLAAYNQGNAGQYLDAISKAYAAMLGGAQGFSGQNLQGITASDASKSKYRSEAYGAYDQDVSDYNRWNEGDAQRNWDIKQRNQGANDAQLKKDQAAGALDQLKSAVSGFKSGSQYPFYTGMAPIWQQEAGITPGSYGAATGMKKSAKAGLNPNKPSEYMWGMG